MKETVYNEKMEALTKRKNQLQINLDKLSGQIAKCKQEIEKIDNDIIYLGSKHANVTAEEIVDAIRMYKENQKNFDFADSQLKAAKTDDTRAVTASTNGGKSYEN